MRLLEGGRPGGEPRRGRDKLHHLNTVPIRLINDRCVGKYTKPRATVPGRPEIRTEGVAVVTMESDWQTSVEALRATGLGWRG